MNRLNGLGFLLTLVALTGYVIALFEPYPARGLSITGVLIGITIVSLGGGQLS